MGSQNGQTNESNSICESMGTRKRTIGQTFCCLPNLSTIAGGTKVSEQHRLISSLDTPQQYKFRVAKCLFPSSRSERNGWNEGSYTPKLPYDILNSYWWSKQKEKKGNNITTVSKRETKCYNFSPFPATFTMDHVLNLLFPISDYSPMIPLSIL